MLRPVRSAQDGRKGREGVFAFQGGRGKKPTLRGPGALSEKDLLFPETKHGSESFHIIDRVKLVKKESHGIKN